MQHSNKQKIKMKKMPIFLNINPEYLNVISESDIRLQETEGNLCCERIKKAAYLVLPSIGIAHINLNFCPCCGKKIERGEQ